MGTPFGFKKVDRLFNKYNLKVSGMKRRQNAEYSISSEMLADNHNF